MNLTYKCECGMELLDAKAVDLIRTPPQVDDIMLCGSCGIPSKVTLLGLRRMTDEEFRALSDDERRDLDFAQRAIKRQLRNN